jgi:hypothetical protein
VVCLYRLFETRQDTANIPKLAKELRTQGLISEAVKNALTCIKQQNGILGELDHPQTLSINSDRVSHMITELTINGTDVYGRAKLLDTPMGRIAKTISDAGFKWGVSSRGAGNVNESGTVSGFNFVTVDIVAKPSAPDAFPDSLYEALEISKYGRKALTLAEQIREDEKAQKYMQKAIMELFTKDIGQLLTK